MSQSKKNKKRVLRLYFGQWMLWIEVRRGNAWRFKFYGGDATKRAWVFDTPISHINWYRARPKQHQGR